MLASYVFTDRLWLFAEADTVPFAAPVKWSASVVKCLAEHRAVAVMRSKKLMVMTPSVELVSTGAVMLIFPLVTAIQSSAPSYRSLILREILAD